MSLVARYKLDGDATDSVGSNNGTASNVSYVAGRQGQAGSFNGTTSRIALSTNFGLGGTTTPFTISLWLYPTGTSANMQAIGRYDGSKLFQIGIERVSGVSRVRAAYGVSPFDSLGGQTLGASAVVSLSAWSHIVLTFSSAGVGTLYLNGAAIASDASPTGSFASATALAIGWRGGDNAEPFAGLIDDVRPYDNALTAAEVLALYNSYSSLLLRRRRAA